MFQNMRLYSSVVLVAFVAFFFFPLAPNVNEVFAADKDRGFWDVAGDIAQTAVGVIEMTIGVGAVIGGFGTLTAAGSGALIMGGGVVAVADGADRITSSYGNLLNDISD